MAWTKVKTAAVVSVGVLLAAGTTTIVLKEIKSNQIDAYISNLHLNDLEKAPTCLVVRKTHFPGFPARPPSGDLKSYAFGTTQGNKMAGRHLDLKHMIKTAYGFHAVRTVMALNLTTNLFDFLVRYPTTRKKSFRKRSKNNLVMRAELKRLKLMCFYSRLELQEQQT